MFFMFHVFHGSKEGVGTIFGGGTVPSLPATTFNLAVVDKHSTKNW